MLYDITLRITYDYDSPASSGRHLICVQPAHLPGEQTVLSSVLDIRPKPSERIERLDFFGNATTEVVFADAVHDTHFRMKARVDRLVSREPRDVSPVLEELRVDIDSIDSVGPLAPHHFMSKSPRVMPAEEITSWAKAIVGTGATTFSAARMICDAIYDEMTFDAEATVVDTPYEEAFRMKRGVCQDFTHIAIAALRGIGIPAGYVSGIFAHNFASRCGTP